jgi:hypothetical protein
VTALTLQGNLLVKHIFLRLRLRCWSRGLFLLGWVNWWFVAVLVLFRGLRVRLWLRMRLGLGSGFVLVLLGRFWVGLGLRLRSRFVLILLLGWRRRLVLVFLLLAFLFLMLLYNVCQSRAPRMINSVVTTYFAPLLSLRHLLVWVIGTRRL